MDTNKTTYQIIGCAYKVHSKLGPGLLESTYEFCLMAELINAGFKVERQVSLPIVYNDKFLEFGYRIDLLINDEIIIELKAVDEIAPVHKAQLLTYLKLSGKKIGLLINFNVESLKKGIIRMVN